MFIYTALTALSLAGGNFAEPVQVPDPTPAPVTVTVAAPAPPQFFALVCTVPADNPLTPEVEPGTFTMRYYGSDPAVAASPNCEREGR